MSDLLNFHISQGTVECECMERTHNFISGNLAYLNKMLVALKHEGMKSDEFTMICHEKTMSYAVKVDKVELGQVAEGYGVLADGSECQYDEIISFLNN